MALGVKKIPKVIKAAVNKWRKMCKVEDSGGRPVHRPRAGRRRERRLEKEAKKYSWHRSEDNVKASAPLILDPIPGPLAEKMKVECMALE